MEPGRAGELRDWLKRRGARFTTFEKEERAEFRFTHPIDHSKTPDALIVIEEGGIYFCDNLGQSEKTAAIFKGLVDEALRGSGSSDKITIQSL